MVATTTRQIDALCGPHCGNKDGIVGHCGNCHVHWCEASVEPSGARDGGYRIRVPR